MLLNIKKYCLFLAMLLVVNLAACSSSDSGGCKTDQECSPPTPYCDLTSGNCVACLAYCSGRECGPDPACGTSCGDCTGGEVCREGLCICKPQASSGCHQGDVWWFDSCGNPESLITDCAQGCSGSQCTDCTPDCGSRECGPDPVCGASCGVCTGGKTCRDGSCDCASRASVGCHNGDIWWLDSCGTPEELITECTYDCKDGQCQECMPDCGGRECGPDPVCATSCGDCTGGEVCTTDGLCRPEDMPCPEEGCPSGMYCDLSTNRCVVGCMEDSQCSSNESCDVQTHECVCKSEYHRCSGACVSDFSALHCGTSCSPCPVDPHGHETATCDGTNCGIACVAGFHLCSGACVSDSSTATCGTRCTPCPTDPHGTTTCNAGTCGIECHAGYLICSGECSACPPSEGVSTFGCSDGRCVATECHAGYLICSGECSACPPSDGVSTFGCSDGRCVATECQRGYRLCSDVCCAWSISELGSGRHPSLALDRSNNPRVSYVDSENRDLIYARWTGSSWSTEVVDPQVYSYNGTSLELDSGDNPHICYPRFGFEVKYAQWTGDSWTVETVVELDSNYATMGASMALDSRDLPHIIYFWGIGPTWFYHLQKLDSEAWSQRDLIDPSASWETISLAIDINDNPHVTYLASDGERYALRTADSWSIEVIASDLRCNNGSSLSLDGGGVPHIACCQGQKLIYARYETDTGWLVNEIESGDECRDPSIELDHLGNPHIAFVMRDYEGDDALMYARKGGPNQVEHWTIEYIDTLDSLYYAEPKIKIDSAGSPHIVYSDLASLKYAH